MLNFNVCVCVVVGGGGLFLCCCFFNAIFSNSELLAKQTQNLEDIFNDPIFNVNIFQVAY